MSRGKTLEDIDPYIPGIGGKILDNKDKNKDNNVLNVKNLYNDEPKTDNQFTKGQLRSSKNNADKLSPREKTRELSVISTNTSKLCSNLREANRSINKEIYKMLSSFFEGPIDKNMLAENLISIFPIFFEMKGYEINDEEMKNLYGKIKGIVGSRLEKHPEPNPDFNAIGELKNRLISLIPKDNNLDKNLSVGKYSIPNNKRELLKQNRTRMNRHYNRPNYQPDNDGKIDFSELVEKTNDKVRGYSDFEKYLLRVDYDLLVSDINYLSTSIDNFTEKDYITLLSFAISIGCTIKNKEDLEIFRRTVNNVEDTKYTKIRNNRNIEINGNKTLDAFISHQFSSLDVEGAKNFHELKESIEKSLDLYNEVIDFKTELSWELGDLYEKSNVDIKDLEFNDYCKVIILAIIEGCSIENEEDLEIFQRTLRGDETKYTEIHNEFLSDQLILLTDEFEDLYEISNYYSEFSMEYYISRYQEAKRLIEIRESYGDAPITLNKTDDKVNNSNDLSGQEIASGLLQGDDSTNLDSYKIAKSNIDSTEKATLRYSAFGIVFNNLFNQEDPIIQKLISLKIDLRSELSNYGIYNYEDEHAVINQTALKKFMEEVLQNGIFEEREIGDLIGRINSIPDNVNRNFEILCGNFHTDQKTFERVAKIYALGEVIENIKKTFNKGFEGNLNNLGEYMGLELNEQKPAEIVGDCLFLKGKLNGTDITIKYDLSSGKIFMNSFIQISPYGDKISVGNSQPHTQIGRIDSFDCILEGYDSTSIIQPSEDSKEASDTGYNSKESIENPISTKIMQKKLSENKLLQNLQEIGKIASEKAEAQTQENSAVTNLLETFNILPSNFSLDFKKESNLFSALQIINNSNTESIVYFNDKFMPMIMDYCGLKRGKNNEDGCNISKTNSDRYGFQRDESRYNFTFDEHIKYNEDKKYENVRLIREFADNFNTEPNKLKGKGNYDENCQPGFADFIKNKKIISGDKLDYKNMATFIDDLESSKIDYIEHKERENAEKMIYKVRQPEDDSLYT